MVYGLFNVLVGKNMKWIVRGLWAIILGTAFLGGCSAINKKLQIPNNHFLEELAEDFVEGKIGISVDFTPDTPEDD